MRTRAALGFHFSSPSQLQQILFNQSRSFLCQFSSLSSSSAVTKNPNTALVDCLTNTYKFSTTQALSISNRFSSVKSPEKPQTMHKYFRELGFSKTQIQSTVRLTPSILFSDIDRTLRPKMEFFKQLGPEGSDLGKLISKNPWLLERSLNRCLIPWLAFFKKILGSDANNKDFLRILAQWRSGRNPHGLLANCAFLESIGIVGPRLSLILKMRPVIFSLREPKLRGLVSKALDMGFSPDSKIFVHVLHSISSLRDETFKKRLDLLGSFGFSEGECLKMFRGAPFLPKCSEEKLRFGIEFYLYTAEFKKSVLVNSPYLLALSMKQRVVPRYKVFQLLKLKKLLKKEPSFYYMLRLSEGAFLEKFISRFRDDATELLVAYKGHTLDSSDEDES